MSASFYYRITELIAALFILLFTYTAITKAMEFTAFTAVLSRSPLLSSQPVLFTWLIPATELFIASLLFIPATRLPGFYAALGLMVLFTIYLCYMLLFTPHLPCSCGGVLKQMSWHQHVIFNMVFILLAMLAIVFITKHKLFIAINRRSQKPV